MEIKIGSVLQNLIKNRRVSITEISKNTGISTSTLSEWTSGRKPKDPVQVTKVARFFGVSLHYLLFGEEDQQEPLQKILKEDVFNGTFEITLKRVRISSGEKGDK